MWVRSLPKVPTTGHYWELNPRPFTVIEVTVSDAFTNYVIKTFLVTITDSLDKMK